MIIYNRENIIRKCYDISPTVKELDKYVLSLKNTIEDKIRDYYPKEVLDLALSGKYIIHQGTIDLRYSNLDFLGIKIKSNYYSRWSRLRGNLEVKLNSCLPRLMDGNFTLYLDKEKESFIKKFGEEFYETLKEILKNIVNLANEIDQTLADLEDLLTDPSITLTSVKKYYPELYNIIKENGA